MDYEPEYQQEVGEGEQAMDEADGSDSVCKL